MKNQKKYNFSVIMAIYNVEPYLDEAISSVINQSIGFENNIELILVNDGSPDNSKAICQKYAELYPQNVTYIEKENGGVSSARNAGLKVATGKIVNFLDSDDYFTLNAFERVLDFFEHNDTDVVALKLNNFENSSGSWINDSYFQKTQMIDLNVEPNFMQCQVGASFVKREIAQKYTFDTKIKIHEDSHYLYRIFRDSPRCGVISDAIYWHRIRKNKSSATQTIKHKNNIFSITNNVFLDIINFYKKEYQEIPHFLQTFIILEFNYYVMEKINICKFTKEEKATIIPKILKVISSLNIEDITNHFVISEDSKKRFLMIKNNEKAITNVFTKLSKNPFKIVNIGIKKIVGKLLRLLKKIVLYIPRKIFRRVLLNTNNRLANIEYLASDHNETINNLKSNNDIMQQTINDLVMKNSKLEYMITQNNSIVNQMADDVTELYQNHPKNKYKYFIYFHSGSRNHGCEAIIKTTTKIIKKSDGKIMLQSFRRNEDLIYINKDIDYITQPRITNENKELFYLGNCCFNKDDIGLSTLKERFSNNGIAISIGGDNYCYEQSIRDLLYNYNNILHNYGMKTVLLGCSIEEDIIKDSQTKKDLMKYDLIVARESLTYNYLIENGVNYNTKLCPDPAFTLKSVELPLPQGFIENNTIGINISPLVLDRNNNQDLILNNCIKLIDYIIKNTNYNIALIPHVCWEKSNDLESLSILYNHFIYSNRICLIDEHNCEELKGYIKRCKMFIGARTHATIAAYSTMTPTLVLGYSIKSKGIAKDLFGTDENYVISIKNINNDNQLLEQFKWLDKNYTKVKNQLQKIIPTYIKNAELINTYLQDLENNSSKRLPFEECYGCTACASICPKKCITMEVNEEGFEYPKIDYEKCIHCNKCLDVCPILNKHNKVSNIECYAVKNKSLKTRLASSSGGIFYELALSTIETGGYVVGCVLDNKIVKHIISNDINDIKRMQGSKYVQSSINTIYLEVREKLKKSKVMFTGTPCQIQGLKTFLGKEYENLICVDFICHGVPSPKVFKLYFENMETKYGTINHVDFRSKDNGWKKFSIKIKCKKDEIVEVYSKNIYERSFLQNLYLRPSCYKCNAKEFTSNSDLTIGDYWGIEKIEPEFDDDNGVSVLIIKTNNGKKAYNEVKEKFAEIKTDVINVIVNNPNIVKSACENLNRENFFKELDTKNIEELITKNLY